MRSKSFSLVSVCQEMNGKHAELISGHTMNEVDCMGKITNGTDFCLKILGKESKYIRAEVMEQTKNLLCFTGEAVSLSISCEGSHTKFCLNAKVSCSELRTKYAYSLDLAHQSVVDKTLNCHFVSAEENPLDEL